MTEKNVTSQELVAKVYHTDARVTAMEHQLGDLAQGMNRIEAHLLNKPAPNYVGWVGAALTGLAMVAGFLWVSIQYTHLQLEPIHEKVAERNSVVQSYGEFKHQTHYEFGMLHEWKTANERETASSQETIGRIQDRLDRVERETSRNSEKVANNTAEIERIDLYGSRRWNRNP